MPDNLWTAWNLDPFAIAIVAAFVLMSFERGRPLTSQSRPALPLIIGTILFLSPLCALTTALFSARIMHHLVLTTVLAPLMAIVLLSKRPKLVSLIPVEAVFIFHTGIYWLWHLPPGYAFALSGNVEYWLMQGALLVSGIWLWAWLLSPRTSAMSVMTLSLGTVAQMGMLAAILTLAPQPLFPAHFLTTQAFGLEPLQDQQIAGTLMWTIGLIPYLALAIIRLFRTLADAPAARRR